MPKRTTVSLKSKRSSPPSASSSALSQTSAAFLQRRVPLSSLDYTIKILP